MKVIAIAAIAAAAGLATASPITATGLTQYGVDNAGAPTQTMVIDISGIESWDEQGNALNTVIQANLGAGATVTGIGWDVILTSVGASWASEATMGFEGLVNLAVGAGDDVAVSMMAYSSGGALVDLSDNGIPDIVLADGLLDIEFFESFVDNAGAADSIYENGSSITIGYTVPAPSALAVLGLGGIAAGRRRR